MNVFYVFEDQEIGPPLRMPFQFGSEAEAKSWIERRKTLPVFQNVNYTVEPDSPPHDAEQASRFRDA